MNRRAITRELLIFLAFLGLTALMTWPWVLHLRDAVADPGDPYMISWTLWWDYYQTFHDPLNLFHANIFYPYRYTLAFSEHDYGIALLFFPLFAAGLRPLTVHSIATFCGFAFCGYGAFRLARTLTGSQAAAWIAGIAFAFIPFRFYLLSHLHYLFAGWIPLLLEALVLFIRQRSWRRAAWLGVAFLMNALTCITWFIMTLIPLALTAIFLLARAPEVARDHAFWKRGAVALGIASLALLPFLLPYYYVSKMYGLSWSAAGVAADSPTLIHWVAAERRTKFWESFATHIPGFYRLFPGLIIPLLSLAAFLRAKPLTEESEGNKEDKSPHWRSRLIFALNVIVILSAVVAVLALGYRGITLSVFGLQIIRLGPNAPDYALIVGACALIIRFSLSPPAVVRHVGVIIRRVREKNRTAASSARRSDAFGIGVIWAVWGFLASLGMNFFLNRILFDYVPLFRSLRIPARWAMICYVGLALLAGLGALKLAEAFKRRYARPPAYLICALMAALLVYELRAFPLDFYRGEVDPDALTLRLRETPMRGGLVELPSGFDLSRHRYMLRAADHRRPLVNATSSFLSPVTWEIIALTGEASIPLKFLDLLENIPTSYLVIHNSYLPPGRRADFEEFAARAVATGRLRFIRRFDDAHDLYAVTKNEPEARSEAPLPFSYVRRDWAAQLGQNPLSLLNQFQRWSQTLYRLHKVTYGRMPRFADFMADMQVIAAGVEVGAQGQDEVLSENMSRFADEWTERAGFSATFKNKTNEQYVDALFANAGVTPEASQRASLVEGLSRGSETRASVLRKVSDNQTFVELERDRALVLLHYFGYLRRDPDAQGFNYWLNVLERHGDASLIREGFMTSDEYKAINRQP
jgi:hypothetical protein